MKFIYSHRGQYWFSEPKDPSGRFFLPEESLGEAINYLKPETLVEAYFFQGKILNIKLPVKIDLRVVEAPPGIRGDTAQGGTKMVTLETGAKVKTPLFIEVGDIVRINTESGEYVERVRGLIKE